MSGASVVAEPAVVRRIEDNIEYKVVDTWARRIKKQWWSRFVKKRQQMSSKEHVQWMLNTAKIRPIGKGGNLHYEDIIEVMDTFTVKDFGSGLRLTKKQIRDGEAFDRAGQWATAMGKAAAMWPQQQTTNILKNGKTKIGYDKVPFFSLAHPLNPFIPGATYPNIHYNMPFSPENLAEGYRLVEEALDVDGQPRNTEAKIVAAGTIERLAVTQALKAEFFADPVRSGTTASAVNVIKTTYGFEEPIIAPEFNERLTGYYDDATGLYSSVQSAGVGKTLKTRGVWYLICDAVEDSEVGGIVYSEAEPFELRGYSFEDDVKLAQMDAYEWQFKGENEIKLGHPYLIHRFEPGPPP